MTTPNLTAVMTKAWAAARRRPPLRRHRPPLPRRGAARRPGPPSAPLVAEVAAMRARVEAEVGRSGPRAAPASPPDGPRRPRSCPAAPPAPSSPATRTASWRASPPGRPARPRPPAPRRPREGGPDHGHAPRRLPPRRPPPPRGLRRASVFSEPGRISEAVFVNLDFAEADMEALAAAPRLRQRRAGHDRAPHRPPARPDQAPSSRPPGATRLPPRRRASRP